MTIVDRRLNPSDKSLGSRQRFIRRASEKIKQTIANDRTPIKDIGRKGTTVRGKGLGEPSFNHDPNTGKRKIVRDGNKDFEEGQLIPKPQGGQGSGRGKASPDGESDDDFEFEISKEEYIDLLFEDLCLPNLEEKELKDILKQKPKRAGYTCSGSPANLSIATTVKRAMGRRIALGRPKQDEIEQLQLLLDEEAAKEDKDFILIEQLAQQIIALERKMKAVAYIDPVDLRYRNTIMQPMPNSQAVIVMLMDVSGSMGEYEKNVAKRFFFLLYLLLFKKYEDVEIVFVRHHVQASECTEHEFFYDQQSGGTTVSSGLILTNEIIRRYSSDKYNLYVAQASDGDNWLGDNPECIKQYNLMLPLLQYFCYIDIAHEGPADWQQNAHTDLWQAVAEVERGHSNMSMARVNGLAEIWPVFTELFKKER